MRAVTVQSIVRTSSPTWYSRTSANSMPCPLNTERYSPVKSELTRPRVRSSSSLTCRRTSGGTAVLIDGERSGALDLREDARHDLVARDFLRLGLEGGEHAMAQDIGRDCLHVVRCHERAPAQERMRARRLGEGDGRARTGTEF